MLTAGNAGDVKAAPALLERAGRMRYLLGDRSYDADRRRRLARDAGAVPVIPGRRNRKRASRYDKLAINFLSGVAPATALAFWRRTGLDLKARADPTENPHARSR